MIAQLCSHAVPCVASQSYQTISVRSAVKAQRKFHSVVTFVAIQHIAPQDL